jgi:ATP dependent DNA ligase domain
VKTTKRLENQKRTEPAFIEPMQCKPVTALPAGEKWTFEIKFDGYRCIAVKRGREITLFSRHKKVLNRRFPSAVRALASLGGDFVLDGELVALDSHGKPSFQLLQGSLSQSVPIYFYAFDLLNENGELLLNLLFSGVASCWKTCLAHLRMRCAYHHCWRRRQDKFLRRCASSAWKVSLANVTIPPMNLPSDQARGSSSARTEIRSS